MVQLTDYYPVLFLLPFLALDLLVRARPYRAPTGWRVRALAVSAASFGFSLLVGRLWLAALPNGTLLDVAALGTFGGALAGILAYELVHYWYHRAAHRWDWLWRLGHQMHHAAESVDAFGAYYIHPLDAALFTTWAVLVFVPVLGLTAEASAIALAFLAFNAAFQHANIRTPRWLGYLVQRPESHAVHHAKGVHDHNFSDLPLWDLLFGTWVNPAEAVTAPAGFWQGASSRLLDLLGFREVAGSPAPERSLPAP